MSRDVVARMAKTSRETITRFELDPVSVRDATLRDRIATVYVELRGMLARFPLVSA